MPTKRKPQQKRRISSPVRRKRPGLFVRFLQHVPGWAWWIGGGCIVALYIFFFYYIFVGPFGFRYHQGQIDWEELKDNGQIDKYPVRFIYVKATEGASIIDENFRDNFHQAREYGFTRGAYHFYSVHSPAKAQAEYFIKNVQLENGDLPPVLDVEHKPKNQTDEEFKASVLQWLEIVEKHYHIKPIIYTYYKFKLKYLNDSVFDSYPYWIAHYYVEQVTYEGPWKFWQHTDNGRLAGIKGTVDFNIYNGSFYDLRKLTIGAREQIGEEAYQDE